MLLLYLRKIMFKKARKVLSEEEIEKPGDRLHEAKRLQKSAQIRFATLVINWSPANVRRGVN